MITNDNGERVSAKEKAKLLYKEHLEKFEFIEESEFSKGDIVGLQDQLEKIKTRLLRNLVTKTGE